MKIRVSFTLDEVTVDSLKGDIESAWGVDPEHVTVRVLEKWFDAEDTLADYVDHYGITLEEVE